MKGVGRTMKGVGRTMKGVGRTMKGVGRTMKGVGRTMKGVGRTMCGYHGDMCGYYARTMKGLLGPLHSHTPWMMLLLFSPKTYISPKPNFLSPSSLWIIPRVSGESLDGRSQILVVVCDMSR